MAGEISLLDFLLSIDLHNYGLSKGIKINNFRGQIISRRFQNKNNSSIFLFTHSFVEQKNIKFFFNIFFFLKLQKMNKREILERQCERLRENEHKIYQGIKMRQQKLQKEMEQQKMLQECEAKRKQAIRDKNMKEQVTHPYNQRGGMWVYLANCLHQEQSNNLDDIRARQNERLKFRERLEQEKQLQKMRQKYIEAPHLYSEDDDTSNLKGGKKQNNQEQIPWKLMRQLRQHDVNENKARMQKIRQNQLKQAKSYHY